MVTTQAGSDWIPIHPPRALAPVELRLLEFLLSRPFPGCDELRNQLKSAKVSGVCPCGCPSLHLITERSVWLRAPVLGRVPVEAHGQQPSGAWASIFLHVVHQYLDELEIVGMGSDVITACPSPEDLRLHVWDAPE
jgi:hypothetical protein